MLVNTSRDGRVAHPYSSKDRSSSTQDPSRPCPACLFIWLFICTLYYFLYNKPMSLSFSLSSVSCYSKLPNLRRRLQAPQFVTGSSEVQVETGDLRLVSEEGAVLWDRAFNLGICANPEELVSELNCRTSDWCLESWRIGWCEVNVWYM